MSAHVWQWATCNEHVRRKEICCCDAYIYTTVGIYISFLVMTAMLRRITRHLYCIGGHDDF